MDRVLVVGAEWESVQKGRKWHCSDRTRGKGEAFHEIRNAVTWSSGASLKRSLEAHRVHGQRGCSEDRKMDINSSSLEGISIGIH